VYLSGLAEQKNIFYRLLFGALTEDHIKIRPIPEYINCYATSNSGILFVTKQKKKLIKRKFWVLNIGYLGLCYKNLDKRLELQLAARGKQQRNTLISVQNPRNIFRKDQ